MLVFSSAILFVRLYSSFGCFFLSYTIFSIKPIKDDEKKFLVLWEILFLIDEIRLAILIPTDIIQ